MDGKPPVSPRPNTRPDQPDIPDDVREHDQQYAIESLVAIPNGTIFAYNLDDSKTPGGLKVRWKIRVATGPEAARWDARQADAIKELLQWASQRHKHRPR